MKKIIALATTLVSATSVAAGELAYVAPEVVMLEEPATMGGSGAWLIPLIILSVLILTYTSTDSGNGPVPVFK